MPSAPPSSSLDQWLPRHPLRADDGLGPDAPLRPPGASWTLLPEVRGVAFLAAFLLEAVLLALAWRPRGAWAPGSALPAALTVVAYLLVAGGLERRRPPIELSPLRLGGLAAGAGLGAALLLATAGLVALGGGYALVPGAPPPVWWRPVVAGLVVGVAEETLFRGIFLRLLEERAGTWVALLVSASLFGAAHAGGPGASTWRVGAIALGGGLALGALYLLTRSLWVVVGCHAAWNAAQALLGIDTDLAPGATSVRLAGPDWLTGGAGNVESSVVAIGLQAALAVACCVLVARRGQVVAPSWRRRIRAEAPAPAAPAASP